MRHLAHRATCTICGKCDEDSFHALVTCDNAATLWGTMEEVWSIPKKEQVVHTGDEWLLNLLDQNTSEVRDMIIMLLWRIWYLWNELSHGKEIPS